MMKITVIALASLKEKYMRDASVEYEKRLSRYCKLEIIELEPVRLPEKPSEAEISAALKKEAELIIKKIPSGSMKIAACIEGNSFRARNLRGSSKLRLCKAERSRLLSAALTVLRKRLRI